jgi:hypothetical protein
MRVEDMSGIVPTMQDMVGCNFTFYESDMREINQFSIIQLGPTTFTGKANWIDYVVLA